MCFHPAQLEAFVTAIARMDRTLRGTARLTSGFEDHYVELEVDHMGGVWVSGELFEYAQQSQHLRFGFRTDQTCLGPLADDLQACLHMPAT